MVSMATTRSRSDGCASSWKGENPVGPGDRESAARMTRSRGFVRTDRHLAAPVKRLNAHLAVAACPLEKHLDRRVHDLSLPAGLIPKALRRTPRILTIKGVRRLRQPGSRQDVEGRSRCASASGSGSLSLWEHWQRCPCLSSPRPTPPPPS